MEEIVLFMLRVVGYVLSEIIFGTIFYWLGWPFVKLATLGNYPKKGWKEGSVEATYVVCVGVVIFVVAIMAVLGQF